MQTNKIYNESCLDTMAKMPDGFIDLTVTSPPYDNLRSYKNDIDKLWDESAWKPIIKELYRVTKDGGVVVWVVGDATINGSETGTSFKQALWAMECGFKLHDTMIYNRTARFVDANRYYQDFEYMFIFCKNKLKSFNGIEVSSNRSGKKITAYKRNKSGVSMKDHGYVSNKISKDKKRHSNIWYIPAGNMVSSVDKIAYNHPAIYPEELAKRHIYSWSNEGDLIYDPFTGSGTTLKMAHLQKRNWIGSEISKEYTELAYKRIQPYLNQTKLF